MKAVVQTSIGFFFCVLWSPVAGQRLELGVAEVMLNEEACIPVILSSDVPAQAVQAVFEWDGDAGTGVELIIDQAVADAANFVNVHVGADWMTLGITTVTSPLIGDDLLLATVVIRCGAGPADTDAAVVFRDNVHNVPGSPLTIANAVTVGGASVRRDDGLELVDGSFRCIAQIRHDTYRLALGSADSRPGSEARIPLTLSTNAAVQAVLAVFEWDVNAGTGVDLIVDQAVADAANFMNVHIDTDWMSVGITTVASPLMGDDLFLATAVIRCGAGPGDTDTAIVFRDDVHNVPGSPLMLANSVTVGGASVRRDDGLELVDGGFRCMDVGEFYRLTIGSAEGAFGSVVRLPLTLSTDGEVQGLQAVFGWDSNAGTGVELIVDPVLAAAADFVNTHVEDDWMTIAVGSFDSFFTGNDVALGTAVIRCGGEPNDTDVPIAFKDGLHRLPSGLLLDNVVTVDGASIQEPDGLELADGSFQCTGGPPTPEIDVTPRSLEFGTVTVGGAQTLDVTIRNLGPVDLEVSDISLEVTTSPNFTISVAPTTPVMIASGDEVTVGVAYGPREIEPASGTLTVKSNDADEPEISVTLSGTGEGTAGTPFRRGDVNGDGATNNRRPDRPVELSVRRSRRTEVPGERRCQR